MNYPQPNLIWIPANNANFMVGRNGTPVRKIAFHHVVGTAESAVSKFQQPVQVSAHFIVGHDRIYCMVDTDDTAYCNGNWASNLESVCIEHEGTWLNGFRDEGVIANSANLVAWLRSLYPSASPIRHRDVMATQCPGDLPVEEIWNRATTLLNPPAPTPPPQAEWLTNRKTYPKTMYVQVANTQLWNLNNPSVPADGRVFPVNTQISIGSKTTVGAQTFYITEYSTGKNIAAGYREADLSVTPYSQPQQPPAPGPVVPAPEPTPPPPNPPAIPPAPTPVDPTPTPSNPPTPPANEGDNPEPPTVPQPNPSWKDYGTSLIRTYVPYGVGLVVTWLASRGIHISPEDQVKIIGGGTFLVGSAYYAVVRWIERKFPKAGVLLGKAKSPDYSVTAK